MQILNTVTLTSGTSKASDTYGYNMLTARNEQGKVMTRMSGGGYDMQNAVRCDILCNLFQSELVEALAGVDLEGTGLGSHPFYCFNRGTDGSISVNGASGSKTTAKLLEVLKVTMSESAWVNNKCVVSFSV